MRFKPGLHRARRHGIFLCFAVRLRIQFEFENRVLPIFSSQRGLQAPRQAPEAGC
jgi:hypothetical protein